MLVVSSFHVNSNTANIYEILDTTCYNICMVLVCSMCRMNGSATIIDIGAPIVNLSSGLQYRLLNCA
jgi:hypothetical protein